MKLDEILGKPLDYKIAEQTKSFYQVEFTAGKREIRFIAQNESLEYGDEDDGEWMIEFGETTSDGSVAHGKTGSGNEFEVFATLKSILVDFIEKRNPTAILFSADKDKKNNRARVYAKMFQKNLPAGWHLEKDETPVAHEPVFFKLVRT